MLLIIDGGPPILAPVSTAIQDALGSFAATLTVDTETTLGFFRVSRIAPELVEIAHHTAREIRATTPLTLDQANRILQRATGGDSTWDQAVAWQPGPPVPRRKKALAGVRRFLPITLFLGLYIGGIVLISAIPAAAYYNERCQSYAAAHGLTFIRYHGGKSNRCIMAEGDVPLSTLNAAAPPSTLNVLLFDLSLLVIAMGIALFFVAGLLAIGAAWLLQRRERRADSRPFGQSTGR